MLRQMREHLSWAQLFRCMNSSSNIKTKMAVLYICTRKLSLVGREWALEFHFMCMKLVLMSLLFHTVYYTSMQRVTYRMYCLSEARLYWGQFLRVRHDVIEFVAWGRVVHWPMLGIWWFVASCHVSWLPYPRMTWCALETTLVSAEVVWHRCLFWAGKTEAFSGMLAAVSMSAMVPSSQHEVRHVRWCGLRFAAMVIWNSCSFNAFCLLALLLRNIII
jgi:hypothetical protein